MREKQDKIDQLQFAKHVIDPPRKKAMRMGWIAKTELKQLYQKHFNEHGFLQSSSWFAFSAEFFYLPDVFLRGMDNQRFGQVRILNRCSILEPVGLEFLVVGPSSVLGLVVFSILKLVVFSSW